MTSSAVSSAPENDVELVAQSLAGSQRAFGRIVERYQSLICALAFSATGNLGQSEDLAQKTFVIAWQCLSNLREPGKLRSWLCGIARHNINSDRRRLGREPAHAAEPLEAAEALAAPEPVPLAQAITSEEVALLWREIGQLPEAYREPLVLFYREHQSVARVAEALELNEDAVTQRLSRGRRLLHERMLVFVESALERTNPGPSFLAGVQAALPTLAAGSQAAAAVAMSKGASLKGGGTLAVIVGWMLAPVLGLLAAAGLSWSSVRHAPNPDARRFAVRWNKLLWISVGGLMLGFMVMNVAGERWRWSNATYVWAGVGVWGCYLLALGALLVVSFRMALVLRGQADAAGVTGDPAPIRTHAFTVLGTYMASTAWLIWLAWITGDRWTAGLLALFVAGLMAWNFQRVRGLSTAAAYLPNAIFNAGLCGVILAIVNVRLDAWLAPIYRVSAAEMHRLLPLTVVHLLTLVLVAWVGWVFRLTKPGEAPTVAAG